MTSINNWYTEYPQDYYAPNKDLSGQRYGFLEVVRPAPLQFRYDRSKREWRVEPAVQWFCRCTRCGNPLPFPVREASLLSGATKSCGCINRENNEKYLEKGRAARWSKTEEEEPEDMLEDDPELEPELSRTDRLNLYALRGFLEDGEAVLVDDMAYLLDCSERDVYDYVFRFNQDGKGFITITVDGLRLNP